MGSQAAAAGCDDIGDCGALRGQWFVAPPPLRPLNRTAPLSHFLAMSAERGRNNGVFSPLSLLRAVRRVVVGGSSRWMVRVAARARVRYAQTSFHPFGVTPRQMRALLDVAKFVDYPCDGGGAVLLCEEGAAPNEARRPPPPPSSRRRLRRRRSRVVSAAVIASSSPPPLSSRRRPRRRCPRVAAAAAALASSPLPSSSRRLPPRGPVETLHRGGVLRHCTKEESQRRMLQPRERDLASEAAGASPSGSDTHARTAVVARGGQGQ